VSVLVVALLCLSSSTGVASDKIFLGGSVQDTLGNLLDGVEVLIASPTSAGRPVAVTTSDRNGRFAIPSLLPGTYRIAAWKDGYLTFVGKVDTQVESWVDLVLRPMPGPDDADAALLPRDASWVLRLPRRSVFRETEATVPEAAADDAAAAVAPASDMLQMQVDQVFSVGEGLGVAPGTAADSHGMETRLRLASALGERGQIRVLGARESLNSSWSSKSRRSATQEAESLSLAMSYDTSLDTQLAVKAFYRTNDLDWDTPLPVGAAADRSRQSWGYQSEWSTQVNARSRVAVKMDYSDSSIWLPADVVDAHRAPGANPGTTALANRAVAAGGTFESLAGDGHQLRVAFRAQLFDSPSTTWYASHDGVAPHAAGVPGWTVRFNAQDTWSVSRPFTLVYGVGYRHALTDANASLFVPRVGGRWNLDTLAFGVMVSYHAVADWEDVPLATVKPLERIALMQVGRGYVVPFQPNDRLGYEAELELPIAEGVRLRGATRYEPVQIDPVGYSADALDLSQRPLFLTDGNAAVRESSVALVQDEGGARTFLELSTGSADGTLAPVLPLDVVVLELAPSRLAYKNGRFGVQIPASGTDVQVEYRNIAGRARGDDAAESRQEYLELRLIQDVLRLQTLGHWRFLMAVRLASLESENENDWVPGDDAVLLAETNSGVSAGLSVSF
jgi:hypothetical protein